jgi:5,10-methenyltetrahydromethanopterin hydrogenase
MKNKIVSKIVANVQKEKEDSLKEYITFLNEAGNNFKLTSLDLHNLTDLEMMMPAWLVKDVLKPNRMDKWFWKFFGRIEEITLADKKDYKKILNKLKKENNGKKRI